MLIQRTAGISGLLEHSSHKLWGQEMEEKGNHYNWKVGETPSLWELRYFYFTQKIIDIQRRYRNCYGIFLILYSSIQEKCKY